jgi:hypothetical protein
MAVPIDPEIINTVRPRRPSVPAVPRFSSPGVTAPQQANPLGGVLTDPQVVLADSARQRAIQAANAVLRQQRSQALIGFGSPELARSLGDTVDPNTAGAAGANQYSVLANLLHQNQGLHRGLLNNLAGRGILHSGELGFQEGEQARGYGQALYGAQQSLLAQLSDYLGANLGSQQSANDAYQQALLAAWARYGQNPTGAI